MGRTDHLLIQKVVLDAGPVIHLEEIGCLNLLSDFKELLIPESVWIEIEHHKPSALRKKEVKFIKTKISIKREDYFSIISNAFSIKLAETTVIF